MSDRIPVIVDWTPDLYASGTKAFQQTHFKGLQWTYFIVLASVIFTAFVLGVPLMDAVMRDPGDDKVSFENGILAGLILIFAAIIIYVVTVSFLNRRVFRQMTFESPYFSRPWTITVSVQGIENSGPYHTSTIDWGAIIDYKTTDWGVVLSLGPGGFIPLPDAGLPEGTSRDDLLRGIESWRAASDF